MDESNDLLPAARDDIAPPSVDRKRVRRRDDERVALIGGHPGDEREWPDDERRDSHWVEV